MMIAMKNIVRNIMWSFVIVMMTGCASKTDLYMLQDDVKQLKSQTQRAGGESAEVYSEVQQLREEVVQLRGTIEELRYQMATSEQPAAPAAPESAVFSEGMGADKQVFEKVVLPKEVSPVQTVDTTAAAVSEIPPEPSPVPAIDEQELYDAGIRYFEGYSYPLARKEFGLLLDNYPSSGLADDAQYFIAETYYNEKWYEKAILEYQIVIEKYPEGDKRPSAFFKQGLAFESIGDSTNAKIRYRELVEFYPDSNEAGIVKEKLQ